MVLLRSWYAAPSQSWRPVVHGTFDWVLASNTEAVRRSVIIGVADGYKLQAALPALLPDWARDEKSDKFAGDVSLVVAVAGLVGGLCGFFAFNTALHAHHKRGQLTRDLLAAVVACTVGGVSVSWACCLANQKRHLERAVHATVEAAHGAAIAWHALETTVVDSAVWVSCAELAARDLGAPSPLAQWASSTIFLEQSTLFGGVQPQCVKLRRTIYDALLRAARQIFATSSGDKCAFDESELDGLGASTEEELVPSMGLIRERLHVLRADCRDHIIRDLLGLHEPISLQSTRLWARTLEAFCRAVASSVDEARREIQAALCDEYDQFRNPMQEPQLETCTDETPAWRVHVSSVYKTLLEMYLEMPVLGTSTEDDGLAAEDAIRTHYFALQAALRRMHASVQEYSSKHSSSQPGFGSVYPKVHARAAEEQILEGRGCPSNPADENPSSIGGPACSMQMIPPEVQRSYLEELKETLSSRPTPKESLRPLS